MSLGTETVIFDQLASDPVSPEAGEFWFNATDGVFRFFTGSTVITLPGGGSIPATQVGQVLFSVDGSTFTAETPVTADGGWLVNAHGIQIVNG